jgi:hypothetical protein
MATPRQRQGSRLWQCRLPKQTTVAVSPQCSMSLSGHIVDPREQSLGARLTSVVRHTVLYRQAPGAPGVHRCGSARSSQPRPRPLPVRASTDGRTGGRVSGARANGRSRPTWNVRDRRHQRRQCYGQPTSACTKRAQGPAQSYSPRAVTYRRFVHIAAVQLTSRSPMSPPCRRYQSRRRQVTQVPASAT